MNKEFHIKKRQELESMIEDNSIVVLFAKKAKQKSTDTNFPFAPDRNFYYITGVEEENSIFLLLNCNDKCEEYLFVQRPNEYQIKYFGPMLDNKGFSESTGIQNVYYIDEFNKMFGKLILQNSCDIVYLDCKKQEFSRNLDEVSIFANDLRLSYPNIVIKNIYDVIFNMRIIKSLEEKAVLQKAIDITKIGIDNILKNIKVGISENELQAYFEFSLRCNGANGHGFNPIIASGLNSLALHYDKNNKTLEEDDLVLLDVGAEYNYYSADISRTFPVKSRFTDKQRYYYEAVLESQNEAISIMRPGIEMKKTREAANKVLSKYLIKDRIILDEKEVASYLNHGICHCIGLDVHEGDSMIMREGMILTCEPGIYLKEYGFGIRIEDDIYITEKGHEVMSKDIIKETIEIENIKRNVK